MGVLFPPEAAALYVDMTPDIARGATTAMSATAEPLLEAVRSGSRPNAERQLARVEREGCGYCHRRGYQ
ncbi:hypothetical protein D3C83_299440 [compost metagenome]